MELAETIKITIEAKACPVHDIHPIVEIVNTEINVSCCCAEFQEECARDIQNLYLHNKSFPYVIDDEVLV